MEYQPHKTIIIAEKYKDILNGNHSFLTREYLEIRTVRSNTEALVLHRQLQADLVVTGTDIPGISGEELCQAIRSDTDLKDMSIIIISPELDNNEVPNIKACSANVVMAAGTQPKTFTETARKLLNVADRTALRVPVSVRVSGKDSHGRPFLGMTENLSTTGMLVESEKKLNEEDIVTCAFCLGSNTHIIINAEVVRVVNHSASHKPNQYGVKFADLAGGVLDAIEAYMTRENLPA